MGTQVGQEIPSVAKWNETFSGDYNLAIRNVSGEQMEALNKTQEAFQTVGRVISEVLDVTTPQYQAIMGYLLAGHALADNAILFTRTTARH